MLFKVNCLNIFLGFSVLFCLFVYIIGQFNLQAILVPGMASKSLTSYPKKIVVIGKKPSTSCLRNGTDWEIAGGGIVGCSTAYYLTRHAMYNPRVDSIVVLEASRIAGGASGKGGGFIADWATPKSLAPLSFNLHNQLAKEHNGSKVWGYRNVYAAEIKLQARNLPDKKLNIGDSSHLNVKFPSALDWLLPGSVQKYDEIGTPSNSGQVNPLMFTTTLAQLAEGNGAKIIIGSASQINYEGDAVSSVTYIRGDKTHTLMATDVVVAAGENDSGSRRLHGEAVGNSLNCRGYLLWFGGWRPL